MFSRSSVSNLVTFPRVLQGGFGLIELMVSISIMVLVASIILVQQGSFNSALLLRDQVYEVALHVREVQLSAVSASGDVDTDFRSILGVYFTSDTTDNDHYHVYKDTGTNGFYDSGEEWGQTGQLDSRFEVRQIRIDSTPISEIGVVFVRPNFDARFFGSSGEFSKESTVEIDIARVGTTGTTIEELRTLEITRTGQIAVQ
jgi:prepilin-type N-terminal cleavage/methylation domain-containing protein